MGKVLHERLREIANAADCNSAREALGVCLGDEEGCDWCCEKALECIAEEIERDYIPRPRDVNGVPLRRGLCIDEEEVYDFCICTDGNWTAYDEDGAAIINGYGDFGGEFQERSDTWQDILADMLEYKAKMNSAADAEDFGAFIKRIQRKAGEGE